MIDPEITIDQQELAPRHQWPRCFLAIDSGQIRKEAHQFTECFWIEDVQLPQSGLGLMKIREGALGELFFSGEIPLATARVRITTLDGEYADGAAQILDDRVRLARDIAILDAVLAHRLPGHHTIIPLLQKGQDNLLAQSKERKALLETTRVSFSLLGHAEEDDDV